MKRSVAKLNAEVLKPKAILQRIEFNAYKGDTDRKGKRRQLIVHFIISHGAAVLQSVGQPYNRIPAPVVQHYS